LIKNSQLEGFGLPIIEAMASGCTVVSTYTGGNREFCRDNDTCLLFKYNDIRGIITCVEKIFNDKRLRLTLIKNGLIEAQKYDINKTIDNLEKEFNY